MTVIFCVDGLQKLEKNGTKNCAFYHAFTALCGFFISSTAFVICVCSATAGMPFERALAGSTSKHVFLFPPALCGDEVLSVRTRIGKQFVEDMGGQGQALKALTEVLQAHNDRSLEEMDPTILFDKVCEALQRRYGEIFDSPLFRDAKVCQEVVVAILLCRTYDIFDPIGQTNLTVDELCTVVCFD